MERTEEFTSPPSLLEQVNAAIANGVDLNEVQDGGLSLLHKAAMRNDMEAYNALISAGAKVDTVDEVGNTALHVAKWYENDDIYNALIAKGANPNKKNNIGFTPNNVNSVKKDIHNKSVSKFKRLAESYRQLTRKKDKLKPRGSNNQGKSSGNGIRRA